MVTHQCYHRPSDVPVILSPGVIMSTLTADDLTERGIAAFKSGDKRTAVDLLYQATQADPANQRAWLWLAGAVPSPEGRRTCLEHVITIAPASPLAEKARAGLSQLGISIGADTQIATPPTQPILSVASATVSPESPLASRLALAAAKAETPSWTTPPPPGVAPLSLPTAPPLAPLHETLPPPIPAPAAETPTDTNLTIPPAPPPGTAPAPRGNSGPWVDIVVMMLLCTCLGWLIGGGVLPEFWAITIITSVILFGLPCAIIHHGKGRAPLLGFLVGSGLGIIGLLIVALSKPDQRQIEADQMASGELRRCPSCSELVRREAKICRFCQRDLPADAAPTRPARRSSGRGELFAGAAAALVLLFLSLYLSAFTNYSYSVSKTNIEATIEAELAR